LCGSREARKKQQKTVAGDGRLTPPKQRAQKGLLLLQLPWLVKVARKRRKNQKICGIRATNRVGFCVKRIAHKNRFFLFFARNYDQDSSLRGVFLCAQLRPGQLTTTTGHLCITIFFLFLFLYSSRRTPKKKPNGIRNVKPKRRKFRLWRLNEKGVLSE